LLHAPSQILQFYIYPEALGKQLWEFIGVVAGVLLNFGLFHKNGVFS
jgi:hypothetical protein